MSYLHASYRCPTNVLPTSYHSQILASSPWEAKGGQFTAGGRTHPECECNDVCEKAPERSHSLRAGLTPRHGLAFLRRPYVSGAALVCTALSTRQTHTANTRNTPQTAHRMSAPSSPVNNGEDGDARQQQMNVDEAPPAGKKSDGKKRIRAEEEEEEKTEVFTLLKIDYENFAVKNIEDTKSKLNCDCCGKRYAKGGRIIQSCTAVVCEPVKDDKGNIVVAETKGHYHCDDCHASEAYICGKGDCTSCVNSGNTSNASFKTKAITDRVILNFALMKINDQLHDQEAEYELLKQKEVQDKMDKLSKESEQLRKDEAKKSRERKKKRLEKKLRELEENAAAATKAVEEAEARVEAAPERIEQNGGEEEEAEEAGGEKDADKEDEQMGEEDVEGEDDAVEQARINMDSAQKRLQDVKDKLAALEQEELVTEPVDESGDEDADSSSGSKKKKKKKDAEEKPKKERTEEQKAETARRRRESMEAKKKEKQKNEDEVATKLANYEKLAQENFKLQGDVCEMSKAVREFEMDKLKFEDEKKSALSQASDSNKALSNWAVLCEHWMRENIDNAKFKEMKKWVRDVSNNHPDQLQSILDAKNAKERAMQAKMAAASKA